VILQEYIPPEHGQDWFAHLYSDANSTCRVLFTGLKVRSWPPGAGVTACAYSIVNPVVAALAERFCAQIGYVGIADLDLRLDRRDGQYKLVDFNPRVGNQFRLFETQAGIDVVRAQHLDLTGRRIPASPQVTGRRIIVEHADLPARVAYRRRPGLRRDASSVKPGPTSTEYAWMATDDPFPFWVMTRHVAGAAARRLRRRLTERFTRSPR
jgi:predicted ATP-grasp superfamily ATP-dependent carboligase